MLFLGREKLSTMPVGGAVPVAAAAAPAAAPAAVESKGIYLINVAFTENLKRVCDD